MTSTGSRCGATSASGVVLVALPRPGDLSGMPRGSADLVAAATEAGECVFVPGIGGALVPTIEPSAPRATRAPR